MDTIIERATMIRNVLRERDQSIHGQRVEERQRVNGQPNGYRPISEAELKAERAARAEPVNTYQVWVHGKRELAETVQRVSSFAARKYMADKHGVRVTEAVARRIWD